MTELQKIYNEVRKCTQCANTMHCCDTMMSPAAMLDNEKTAKVVFIAQNPGEPLPSEKCDKYEDVLMQSKIGRLFISKFLDFSGFEYKDIYWTNLCKCPTEGNATPTKDNYDRCFNFLYRQIECLQSAEYLILLGTQVQNYMTYSVLNLFNEKLLVINFFHPSYLYRINKLELIHLLVNKIKQF